MPRRSEVALSNFRIFETDEECISADDLLKKNDDINDDIIALLDSGSAKEL